MSYRIDAGCKEGRPYLQLRDADSGCVRLAWQGPAAQAAEDSELARALAAEEAMHALFKRLFLLTTEQYLRQPPDEPPAS